tara:strand:+ start:10477 stop:12003 length:1527 start_codon:yes stop_codon:yes gene_type:complete
MREDWIECSLDEVCEKALKVKRKEMPLSEKIKYLDIGAIDNHANKIISHKEYTWEDAPSRAQQIIKKDDILFSTVRTYLKNIAKVNKEEYNDEIGSSGFTVLRAKKDILNSDYLFFRTLSTVFFNTLNKLQRGTSYPAVRDKDVFAQIIPLPTLVEQKAIVKKIEELFSSLDCGIADLKKAQDQLVIYRQAVLKKAFEGELTKEWREKETNLPSADELHEQIKIGRQIFFNTQIEEWELELKKWKEQDESSKKPKKPRPLTVPDPPNTNHNTRKWDIPKNWIWTQIGDLCFVTKLAGFEYTDYVNYDEDGDLPVLKAENAQRNGFKKTDFSKVNSESVKMLTRSQIFGGELLIVFVGNVGNVAMVPLNQRYFLGPNIGMARPYFNFNSKFLELFLQSGVGRSLLMSAVKSVAQPSLSMGTIRQSPVAFPSLEEQHQIVREIESRLSVCDAVEESIVASLEKAQALRQSILKKAFEGKLLSDQEIAACKTHKDYEPASVLLQKIKKTKV